MIQSALPLASRLRPKSLEDFIGQQHIVAPHKPLYQAIKTGNLHSMIFWGPPGTGKTTSTLNSTAKEKNDKERIDFSDEAKTLLAEFADGDARQALNLLEILTTQAPINQGQKVIDKDFVKKMMTTELRKFDKKGDY